MRTKYVQSTTNPCRAWQLQDLMPCVQTKRFIEKSSHHSKLQPRSENTTPGRTPNISRFGYVRSEDQVQTDYEDPDHREPVMSYHKRSHTTPQDAGRAAIFANVKTLALPHYAPADSPLEA